MASIISVSVHGRRLAFLKTGKSAQLKSKFKLEQAVVVPNT